MKLNFGIAALLVGASITAAVPAAATVIAITYSGTVKSGFDTTGVFGAANTDLTGAKFVTRYVFDTTIVPITHAATGNDTVIGGRTYGTEDPIISATLTINGLSYVIDGYTQSEISNTAQEHYSGQVSDAIVSEGSPIVGENTRFMNRVDDGKPNYPQSLEGPFSTAITSAQYGEFNIQKYFYATGVSILAKGTLNNEFLSISAVPEPASWGMFIGGFGLIGGAMRGRRTTIRFA